MKKKKSNTLRNILLVVVVGVIGTCLCLAVMVAVTPRTATPPEATVQSPAGNSPASTEVVAVANTEGPTSTPAPTDTPSPTDTPTPPPAGESRDNPVAAGNTVDIGGDMTLTIVSAIRPADDIVKGGNPFNKDPEAGEEYVQVDVQVVCNKATSDKCNFSAFSMKAVGADGNVREGELFVAGVDGLLESGEFFGGATKIGKVFFIVTKDDTSVVLFYEPFLGDPIYLALP